MRVAKCFYTHVEPAEDVRAAKFEMIVESLEDFHQLGAFDYPHAVAAVSQLAKFHAFFWARRDLLGKGEAQLWDQGE